MQTLESDRMLSLEEAQRLSRRPKDIAADFSQRSQLQNRRGKLFNRSTNTIEDVGSQVNKEMELLEPFGHHTTEAARTRAIANGEALQSYDTGFDSDTSLDEENDSKKYSSV